MAKQIKKTTKTKTAATNKAVAKQTKKGGNTMTKAQISTAINAIRLATNQHVIAYNKKCRTRLDFITTDTIINIIKETNLPEELDKNNILAYIGIILDKTFQYQRTQYYLNKAYGTQHQHYSELSNEQLEELKKEQAKQSEFKNHREQA